jgi:hypothetical protein
MDLETARSPAYDAFKRPELHLRMQSQTTASQLRLVVQGTSLSSTAEVLNGAQRLSNAGYSGLLGPADNFESSDLDQSLPQNAGLPLSG